MYRNLSSQKANACRTIRFEPSMPEAQARKIIDKLGGTIPTQDELHVVTGPAKEPERKYAKLSNDELLRRYHRNEASTSATTLDEEARRMGYAQDLFDELQHRGITP